MFGTYAVTLELLTKRRSQRCACLFSKINSIPPDKSMPPPLMVSPSVAAGLKISVTGYENFAWMAGVVPGGSMMVDDARQMICSPPWLRGWYSMIAPVAMSACFVQGSGNSPGECGLAGRAMRGWLPTTSRS